jgi:hypothetical protein
MSSQSQHAEVVSSIDDPPIAPPLEFPDNWTLSTSWQRAVSERDQGGPINDGERTVWLETGDPHRVVFVLDGTTLRARCSCDGWYYREWCAHVASCWWQWVRGEIAVVHQQTGREYPMPPEWLSFDRQVTLDGLTSAELDAYLTCELGTTGVREYARKTGRAPGTVGNLLRWAREKVQTPHPHAGGGSR